MARDKHCNRKVNANQTEVNGAEVTRRDRQGDADAPPPKSAGEAFWQSAWPRLSPGARLALLAVVLLGLGVFAVWVSLPSSTKSAAISRIGPAEKPSSGFWCVDAALTAESVTPGMLLDLTIEVDHDGYAWVFTVERDRAILVYPQDEDAAAKRHRVEAGRRRAIPGEPDEFGVQAGTMAQQEVLIVIATAHASKAAAWGCLAALRPDLPIKAVPIRTGEWGATELRYEVKD